MENKMEAYKASIQKMFGKKAEIIVDDVENIVLPRFSSGSLLLDKDLKGGWVKGTMIESFGDPSAGKTTLAIHGVAEHQKAYPDEPVLWVDLEKVFDPVYFKAIGIDVSPDKFMLARPNSGEDAWQTIIEFVRTFECGVVVLDSVALLLPKKEDEDDVENNSMALAARMNSKGLRKLWPYMGFGKTTIFAINQTRSNIGGYGDPTVTTGGKGWAFYARTRIKVSKSIGEKGEYSKNKFTQVKSNYGNQDIVTETTIEYGTGFNREKELLTQCVQNGIITKGGAWYTYGEDKYQGEDAFVELIKDNPELFDELYSKLKSHEQLDT